MVGSVKNSSNYYIECNTASKRKNDAKGLAPIKLYSDPVNYQLQSNRKKCLSILLSINLKYKRKFLLLTIKPAIVSSFCEL